MAWAARETLPRSRAAAALNPRDGFSVVFLIISRKNFSVVVGDRPGTPFLNFQVLNNSGNLGPAIAHLWLSPLNVEPAQTAVESGTRVRNAFVR